MATDYGGIYFRGPTDLDWTISTASIVDDVVETIRKDKRVGKEDLYLAGHSRGGYAALMVANRLAGLSRVRAIFLFDAVKRSRDSGDASLLPRNIDKCYHARRDASLSNYVTSSVVAKAEAKFLKCRNSGAALAPVHNSAKLQYDLSLVNSRHPPQDGNCAAEWHEMRRVQFEDIRFRWAMRSQIKVFPAWFIHRYPACGRLTIDFANCLDENQNESDPRYTSEKFLGSHGAIGGAPILDPEASRELLSGDAAAVASVWAWMKPNIEKEGVGKISLAPNAIPGILEAAKPASPVLQTKSR
jgi:pimeloyl-ACP methyl ester carboxylesterase